MQRSTVTAGRLDANSGLACAHILRAAACSSPSRGETPAAATDTRVGRRERSMPRSGIRFRVSPSHLWRHKGSTPCAASARVPATCRTRRSALRATEAPADRRGRLRRSGHFWLGSTMSYLIALLMTALVWISLRSQFASVTIHEYERGLRFVRGAVRGELETGRHWYLRGYTSVRTFDLQAATPRAPRASRREPAAGDHTRARRCRSRLVRHTPKRHQPSNRCAFHRARA